MTAYTKEKSNVTDFTKLSGCNSAPFGIDCKVHTNRIKLRQNKKPLGFDKKNKTAE